MHQILCSTGALIGRPNNRDYRLIEPLSKQLDCDGFEFMMYSSWYDEAEELVRTLRGMRLSIPVMHCEKHIGVALAEGGEENFHHARRLFEINCQMADQIGANRLVMHLWDGLISDRHFENNLRGFALLQPVAERYGIDLLIENVVCNQRDPMTRLHELITCYGERVHLLFDTKMAAFHGQLEQLYLPENKWLSQNNRIRHYHINDYGGAVMEWSRLRALPLGKGHIDFQAFFDFVQKSDYQGDFTVEATAFDESGAVDTDMLNGCFQFIRRHMSENKD